MRSVIIILACAFSFAFAQIEILVNVVGYEKSGAKRAVIQSASSIAETSCDLVNSQGSVVHTISLKAQTTVSGWSNRYFKVADFSEFAQNGKYRLKIGSVQSQEFSIGEKILQEETGAFQVSFFKGMRNTSAGDRNVRIHGTTPSQYHNIYGGWNDATGDKGKHLSHLSYANYFNPQQIPFVAWALLNASELQPSAFGNTATKEEAAWGADYLLRSLSAEGYFYMSVFDEWNLSSNREICAWSGSDGVRSSAYQSAMREGAGVSIAALARASKMGISGDSASAQYLAGAKRAYAHLKANPTRYQDNGKENIIDDYCGLLAASELYNATNDQQYLTDANTRAQSLLNRQHSDGWFYTEDATQNRPFYHAADEGLPIVALARYVEIVQPSSINAIRAAIKKNLLWYVNITYEDSNPFEYAKMYRKVESSSPQVRFFMPHSNETGYWWQGENARIASLSAAFTMGAQLSDPSGRFWYDTLFTMAITQLDWILGKNPFAVSMVFGFGNKNYPNYTAESYIPNIKGGICNGITAKHGNENDLAWNNVDGLNAWDNWRYIEQWLPHNAWYLTAIAALSHRIENPIEEPLSSSSIDGSSSSESSSGGSSSSESSLGGSSSSGSSPVSISRGINVKLPFAARKDTQISIYNLRGQRLISYSIAVGSLEANITMPSNMAKGVYLINIRDATGKSTVVSKIYWN
jgi:uncharacterized membrane protein YgcG